jgi:tRNA-splicing endonuclease subunit Sen54
MQDVLSYTRVHKTGSGGSLRGWYFPDRFVDEQDKEEDVDGRDPSRKGDGASDLTKTENRKRGLHARDRVVVIEGDGGAAGKDIGRVVTGQAKDQAARDRTWLLPEEALFLVERGSLDLWWPTGALETIFPPGDKPSDAPGETPSDEMDEYELGIPLSLQAAYALLVGNEGDRGKITLQKFQVYSNLKRGGYKLLRAPPRSTSTATQHQQLYGASSTPPTIWQWLLSLAMIPSPRAGSSPVPNRTCPPYGPLVRPGIYRSYAPIFQQLFLVPRHKPTSISTESHGNEPFRVHFHVWKAGTGTGAGASGFSKTRPPPPDYYLAVADARRSTIPTLEEVAALMDETPWAPPPAPKAAGSGAGRLPRLKHGFHNVIVAVVDAGVINYVRFADAAFGEELLWTRFDEPKFRAGSKKGGRQRGKGGRGRGGRG